LLSEKIQIDFRNSFPYPLSASQDVWLEKMAVFLSDNASKTLFLMAGYAGTGKSTMIGHLVKRLQPLGYKSVLLAPTGRAAKVLSVFSKRKAFTIHKHIYYTKANKTGGVHFQLKPNKYKNTLFIVDEASMISDDRQSNRLFENGSVLDDLIQYVSGGDQCRLIFIGDTAQLPPVHLEVSPAMDSDQLEGIYQLNTYSSILTDVIRQEKASGILHNATRLRQLISDQLGTGFQFDLKGFADIHRIQDGNELLEALSSALQNEGIDQTAFLVRSNKRANLYNQSIRQRILFLEAELAVGDHLMVVKNNYFWLDDNAEAGFIANGDTIIIERIYGYKNLYGFEFAEVQIALADYPSQAPFDTFILLDTLKSETAALPNEDTDRLYHEVMKDYANIASKYKRLLKVKNNPYFNALQVKYSYAITCHKSQGGQWNTVFVEQPYLAEGTNVAYYRWLYTALTRAKEKLFLVNFKEEFFID
jgi:ATP-dependent exoDNAse (exonuclease V) alpha subunit